MAGPGPAPRTQNPVVATTPVVAWPADQIKTVRPPQIGRETGSHRGRAITSQHIKESGWA